MKTIAVLILMSVFLSVGASAQEAKTLATGKNIQWKVQKVETNQKQVSPRIAYYKSCSSDLWRSKNNIPADFPKYQDTGNPKNDLTRYLEQKKAWIAIHPEEYNTIKHLSL
jgi:hypothetical protein